jgi:hypothetical protein
MHQKGRRGAEGNQVSQGIKFAAKRAFDSTHAGQAAIKQVADAGQQDEAQGDLDVPLPAGPGGASTILVRATNPKNKLPAVIKLGRK